jgi:hypothetical protein
MLGDRRSIGLDNAAETDYGAHRATCSDGSFRGDKADGNGAASLFPS